MNQTQTRCPECQTVMVPYERDGHQCYDCPRCGYDYCDGVEDDEE